MKDITKEWLNFAKADLKSCENNLGDEFLTNIVLFHCQQAIEKCFKALIEEHKLRLKRVHNLVKLYSSISDLIDFEININNLELLDEIYTSSRYPGERGLLPNGNPTIKDAEEMFEFASKVYEKIIKCIPKQ